MAKVIVDMSLSLDGFIAGPADLPDQPFGGRNAQRLHDWLLAGSELYEGSTFLRPPGRNRELVDAMFRTTGALLTGRRTYDLTPFRACRWYGGDENQEPSIAHPPKRMEASTM